MIDFSFLSITVFLLLNFSLKKKSKVNPNNGKLRYGTIFEHTLANSDKPQILLEKRFRYHDPKILHTFSRKHRFFPVAALKMNGKTRKSSIYTKLRNLAWYNRDSFRSDEKKKSFIKIINLINS